MRSAVDVFAVGNSLEGYTMDRARNAIRGLIKLSPRRATVLHGSDEMQVPVEGRRPGEWWASMEEVFHQD